MNAKTSFTAVVLGSLLAATAHVCAADADPVAQSFDRMLTHTPNPAAPPVPAGLGTDPLVAAVVEPLRERLRHSR